MALRAFPEVDLGVVILAYGTSRRFETLLRSVLDSGVEPTSIALVQNPSAPGEPVLKPSDPRVAVLRLHRNLGYAGGMNEGIRHHTARGAQQLLLLTHDVRLRAGTLEALLAASAEHPSAGILGPVLYDAKTGAPFSFGVHRTRSGGLVHLDRPPLERALEHGVVGCDSIDGAAMLIRKEVLDRTGVFTDHFFMYFEESDLCLRTARAGWQVGIVPVAEAEQEVGASSRPGAWGYLMARNGLAYARSAAGALGVAGGLGRFARDVAIHFLLVLRPSTSRTARPVHWLTLRGMARGVVDYFLGRWGPPPPSLAGLGDVTGTN